MLVLRGAEKLHEIVPIGFLLMFAGHCDSIVVLMCLGLRVSRARKEVLIFIYYKDPVIKQQTVLNIQVNSNNLTSCI